MGDRKARWQSSNGGKPQPAAKKPKKWLLKQPQMLRMLYALASLVVVGIYFFGWRVLVLLAVCAAAGAATEWAMARRRGSPLTTANFVTCTLYALSLPPTMPFWMAAVGIVVGVLFGKEVFGGFGKNWANPAIVGRAFVYVAFPVAMTGSFVPAFRGWPGGFAQWSLATMAQPPEWLEGVGKWPVDAVTSATPVVALRDYGYEAPTRDLFLGAIGGVFPVGAGQKVLAAGSIGEVCAPLIILAGIYLLVTRTANWRLMLSPLLAASAMVALLHYVFGVAKVPSLPFSLLSSSLLYACVFMVTEPVSAPRKPAAMWLYGIFIGVTIIMLRWLGQFPGSVSFSILLGNTVGPSLDLAIGAWQDRKKPKKARDGA